MAASDIPDDLVLMPAHPLDCVTALARCRKLGVSPEWVPKAEEKVRDYERELAWKRKRELKR